MASANTAAERTYIHHGAVNSGSLPLYIHIDLRTDNRNALVFWWYASTCRHLGIGGQIMQLGFAILFGGIVLTLALAVGLGSKDMVSRTWERQADKTEKEPEEQFHHL